MRRALRWTNVLAALGPLASGAAVLWSNVVDPGYRAHYRDSLLLALAYVTFYGVVLVAFVRDDRRLAHLAVLKACGAYVFLAAFVTVGPFWMVRTPGRYVYMLFDWGREASVVLMSFVFFGRGIWNTLNATYFTAPWWVPLRTSRPLLGRVLTMLPLGLAAALVAAFVQLRALERQTYSAEAHEVARLVFDGLGCDEIRAKQDTQTTDLRQRGEDRFTVRIRWDCRALRVDVQGADGRLGQFAGARPECCPNVAL